MFEKLLCQRVTGFALSSNPSVSKNFLNQLFSSFLGEPHAPIPKAIKMTLRKDKYKSYESSTIVLFGLLLCLTYSWWYLVGGGCGFFNFWKFKFLLADVKHFNILVCMLLLSAASRKTSLWLKCLEQFLLLYFSSRGAKLIFVLNRYLPSHTEQLVAFTTTRFTFILAKKFRTTYKWFPSIKFP